MKYIVFILSLTILSVSCKPSAEYEKNKDGTITWLSVDQASQLSNNSKKLYFVDVYTEWCGWCKVMDKKTFTDPGVIRLIDENFHAIKFDAEQMDYVTWNDKRYVYKPGGRKGVNDFANHLLDNRLSYPSFAILDSEGQRINTIVGYKTPEQLIPSLKSYLISDD